jgi:hypothetical protein
MIAFNQSISTLCTYARVIFNDSSLDARMSDIVGFGIEPVISFFLVPLIHMPEDT